MDYQRILPKAIGQRFNLTFEEIKEIFLKIAKDTNNITFQKPWISFEKRDYRVDDGNPRFEPHFRFSAREMFSRHRELHIWRFTEEETASILRGYLISRKEVIPEGKVTIYAFEPIMAEGKVVFCVS